MKKTLIALAAVAVSSAAMAQVTISGSYGFGFTSTNVQQKDGGSIKKSGMGSDDAALTFSGTEDLGDGVKATASFGVEGFHRDGGVAGTNASLALTTGLGVITLGNVESGSGIRSRASAGAPVLNLEGEVLGAASFIDIVSFATKISDFTISVNRVDRGETTGSGIGAGTSGPRSAQASHSIGIAYASGPLSIAADTTAWSGKAYGPADSRYRVSGSYDLGVARIGAGMDVAESTANKETTQTMVGVRIPMGKLTLGAVMAKNVTADSANVKEVNKSGTSIGANYDLSKRTSVQLHNSRWTDKAVAFGNGGKSSRMTLTMYHSF